MAKIRGIQTGSTTLRVTYQGTTSSNVTINVQGATPVLTFTATSSTLTYTGSSQVIGTVFYSGDGTVSYAIVKATSQPSVPTSGWTDVAINSNLWTSVTGGKQLNISATDAGTHYVFLKSAAGTNYVALSGRAAGSKQINKANNTVTYAVSASSVWCGTDASARTTTDAAKTVTIATNSASATAGSITYTLTVKNASNATVTGWSIADTGKTVTTSAATAAGTYTVTATATAAETTNYKSGTKSVNASVTVSAVSLNSVALTLSASSVAYNGTTGVSSLIASYNNGSSKNITSSIGVSASSNPKIVSNDTTVATIS